MGGVGSWGGERVEGGKEGGGGGEGRVEGVRVGLDYFTSLRGCRIII